MNALKIFATSVAAGFAVATFAAPAQSPGANPAAGQRQVILQYRGGDLATPATLERTYLRMSRAAEQVCQPYAGRGLARQRVFQRCLDETLGTAVAAIRDPRLTALHASRHTPAAVTDAPIRTARR
jgi:UrcA family protein